MQEPLPNINDNQNQAVRQQDNKDKIPFFYKIIVIIILSVSIASILQPATRKALSNSFYDIFYKGQIWRLFTNEFITFGALDSIITVILSYVSIGRFEKKVGSAIFIIDFILIALLASIIFSFINLIGDLLGGDVEQASLIRQNSGFFGMWFYYISRIHFLQPDRDFQFFCLLIKQRNIPPLLYILLFLLSSFKLPLIVSIAYLLVITQNHCFKNRFFKFSFTFYIKIQKILKGIAKRDDFYRVQECQFAPSFFNNAEELGRLYNQARQLLQNIQNINIIFQQGQNMRDQIQLNQNLPAQIQQIQQATNKQQNTEHQKQSQFPQQQYVEHNDSAMEINLQKEEKQQNV